MKKNDRALKQQRMARDRHVISHKHARHSAFRPPTHLLRPPLPVFSSECSAPLVPRVYTDDGVRIFRSVAEWVTCLEPSRLDVNNMRRWLLRVREMSRQGALK